MINRELENQLREEWKKWQANAHPDDRMSFMDYVDEVGIFKNHRIIVNRDRYGDVEAITFYSLG